MLATLALSGLLSLSFFAQTSPSPQSPTPAAPSVDPKLHADAIKLVKASGSKKKVQEGFPKGLADGRKAMVEHSPTCSPEFADEWVKRMAAQLNPDDFVAIYVEEYEEFLTDDEIIQLTALQIAANDGHPIVATDALKARLQSVLPSLMGEAVGRCAEVGSKLGAEVAAEISKEHPDWITSPTPSDKPAQSK